MVWCLCSLYVLCFSDNTKNALLFEYQESTNWGHYFYVSNWRRDRHFTWSSESHEGLASCSTKGVPSFLSYFKILSIGPAQGNEPATSRSARSQALYQLSWW